MARFRSFAIATAVLAACQAASASAIPPSSRQVDNYLFVGFANGEAIACSNCELGANQEVVSSGSIGGAIRNANFDGNPDLTGTFVPSDGDAAGVNGNRWSHIDPDAPGDTVGSPDGLPGARGVFEGVNYSGNLALTAPGGLFNLSDVDLYAAAGIECAAGAGCIGGALNSAWAQTAASAFEALANSVNGLDPTGLLNEFGDWKTFINGLSTEFTISSDIVNQNSNDASGPLVTDLDAIDSNGDGIAVITVDVGSGAFSVSDSDWILQTNRGVLAVVRLAGEVTQFSLSNSSIMVGGLGTPVVSNVGAIFYTDIFNGVEDVFNLHNVISNGISYWDLNSYMDDTPEDLTDGATRIAMTNTQGCGQFVSTSIQAENGRWTSCAELIPPIVEQQPVPEPSTVVLLGFGLAGLGYLHRRRRAG